MTRRRGQAVTAATAAAVVAIVASCGPANASTGSGSTTSSHGGVGGRGGATAANNTVQCSDRLQFVMLTEDVARVRAFPSAAAANAALATAATDRSVSFIADQAALPPPPFTVDNGTDWCNVTVHSAITGEAVKELSFYKPELATAAPTTLTPTSMSTSAGARDACAGMLAGVDVVCDEGPGGSHAACPRTAAHPDPVAGATVAACCALCGADAECTAWVSAAGASSSATGVAGTGTSGEAVLLDGSSSGGGGGGDNATADATGPCYILAGGFDRTVATAPRGSSSFRTVGLVGGGPPQPTSYPATYLKQHRVQVRGLEASGGTHRAHRGDGGGSSNGGGGGDDDDDGDDSVWRWRAGVDDAAGAAANLRGTLLPTPSADLAGCCANPDAAHGRYDPKYPLDLGVLSTGGWAVLDDSHTPLVRFPAPPTAPSADRHPGSTAAAAAAAGSDAGEGEGVTDPMQLGWIVNGTARDAGEADLYVFGCGAGFAGCVRQFTQAAGRVALPPRHALGVWWSRHWGDLSGNAAMVSDPRVGTMTDKAILSSIVDGYATHEVPLHVVVLDMEWHEMLEPPACQAFGGVKVWGGYSWNATTFPDPAAFVQALRRGNDVVGGGGPGSGPGGAASSVTGQSLRVALNYHPDSGIDACQTAANRRLFAELAGYPAAAADNGTEFPDLNPTADDQRYVEAYFRSMIQTTLADYAWTDSPQVSTWTNHLYTRYNDPNANATGAAVAVAAQEDTAEGMAAGQKAKRLQQTRRRQQTKKKKRRGLNLSRYGGVGNHRTPVGFSGDTLRKWDTLAYEVWMTPRASNVGFAWWSHDIGGFSGGGGSAANYWHTEAPELFLRWLQFAAFSPVLRTHCRYCNQLVWTWGNESGVDWLPAMRAPMVQRSALVPYLYSHAFLETYRHGRGLLTPLYWDDDVTSKTSATAIRNNHDGRRRSSTDPVDPTRPAFAAEYDKQYFFGLDFMVAPITASLLPADSAARSSSSAIPGTAAPTLLSATVERSLWMPRCVPADSLRGDAVATGGGSTGTSSNDCTWVDWCSGEDLGPGGSVVNRSYGLLDTPVFVKSTAVVATTADPVAPGSDAEFLFPPVLSWVLPAPRGNRTGVVFEDDGDSAAYADVTPGDSITTTLTVSDLTTSTTATASSPSASSYSSSTVHLRLSVAAAVTGAPASPATRRHQFVFQNVGALPASVTCDGRPAASVPGANITVARGAAAVAAAGNYVCGGAGTVQDALVVSCGEWATAGSDGHEVEVVLVASTPAASSARRA